MARVVLAAMNSNSGMRSAMNIKYRPKIIEAVKRWGEFSISSFNREDEPSQSSTMEWGTSEAIKTHGSVPDIVYDLGAAGKEPMIRVLGRTSGDVVGKLRKILEQV